MFLHTICSGGNRPWLLVCMRPKDFQAARENFGRVRHIGYHIPREIPKSWTYLQEGWNTHARTPVTRAIEAAVAGDNSTSSAEFHLFGSCLKKSEKQNSKKKKKTQHKVVVASSVKLALPVSVSLDKKAYTIAALVKHFACHQKEPSVLYGAVEYAPSDRERDHLNGILARLVADPRTHGLSTNKILHQYVKKADAFAHYEGVEWEKWFIQELERIRLHTSSPPSPASNTKPSQTGNTAAIKLYLTQIGITDNDVICFVADLCDLAGPATRPFDIVEQWYKVLSACSSHWCRPTLWWCVGSTLVMYHVDGVTRSSEGGVTAPATCIENWDMLAIIRLLQCSIFSEKVRRAVHNVNEYTRRDIAHERFDCEWKHSCQCLVELLKVLGCSMHAEKLKKWYNSKAHTADGGEGDLLMCEVCMLVIF